MSIYTKQGDEGTSNLFSDHAERIKKSDSRFSFLGDVDELSSYLGLIKSQWYGDEHFFIEMLQQQLSLLAASVHQNKIALNNLSPLTEQLEKKIDYMQGLKETTGFVLPGASEQSAQIDIARTVARRAERSLCVLGDKQNIGREALQFLNRLSDYLFALARYVDYNHDCKKSGNKVNGGIEMINESRNVELDLAECKLIMELIEKKAEEMSLSVAIAFCDHNGNPILACSMKDTLLVSFECAMKKAYTAVALKMPTDKAQQISAPGQVFYGLTSLEKLLVIPGGIPIYCNDTLIGGIGVSGGDDVSDVEFAKIGSEFFL